MANVKKIVLDIDGKEIKLNFEQAKELRDILMDMWPRHGTRTIYWDYEYRPYRGPYWHGTYSTYGSTSNDTVYLSTSDGTI